MIALVFSVTAASIFAGSILYVFGSISTKTGFAPTSAIQPAVAKNVKGEVITSSPGPTSRLIRQFNMASVPLVTPTAYSQLQRLATAFSKSSTFDSFARHLSASADLFQAK